MKFIHDFFKQHSTALTSALLWLAVFGLFSINQYSNVLADPDGFYHMKIAQLMLEQGIIKEFTWLPYTTLGQHYIDQHLGLHIIMMPFVALPDPFAGVKVLTAALGATAIVSLALVMRAFGSRWWLICGIVIAVATPFTFRLNLIKATPLAIIGLSIALYLVHTKRYWWLAVLSALFVWIYGGFPLLLLVIAFYVIAHVITAKKINTAAWKSMAAAVGGMVVGIVINPYFPNNLYFYWEQFVQIGVINYQDVIKVGSEWYPYDPGNLLFGMALVMSLGVCAVVLKIIRREAWDALDWFALMLLLFGLALTLKSRRYIEYSGAFTILAISLWLRTITLQTIFTHSMQSTWRRATGYACLAVFVGIVSVPIIASDIRINLTDLKDGSDVTKYQAASQWLREQTESQAEQQGEYQPIVVHSDWDDFPQLFYYNSNVRYISGLDPTFLYRANPELHTVWVELTIGNYKGDVDEALQALQAEYVLIEEDHVAMYNLVNKSDITTLVYSDDEADIFKVDLE